MSEKIVNLIECFRSFQGEGPDSGRSMYILRFKTCNRNCYWCDTSVKMRISVEAPYKVSDIQKLLYEHSSGILVTGGEPTVPKHFDEAVTLFNELKYPIANLETNGYALYELIGEVIPTKPVKFIFSPKIFTANDKYEAINVLNKVAGHQNVFVKLVFEPNNEQLSSFIEYLLKEMQDLIKEQRIWLMPEGTNRADLIKNSAEVFDACEEYNFNFSSRSHIIFGFV